MIPINKRKRAVPGVAVKIVTTAPPPPPAVLPKSLIETKKKREHTTPGGMVWHVTDRGTWSCYDALRTVNALELDFLVHSYLYYYLNITIVTDTFYDNTCKWLIQHMKAEPEVYEVSAYRYLCDGLDESASGFYIKEEDYPLVVKQRAVQLLTNYKRVIPPQLKGVAPYEPKNI